MKYLLYRKMMAKQKKGSMKTTEEDLKGMIKEAVKEALEGEGEDKGEGTEEEEVVADDISGMLADAIEAVNEKRKSRKEDPIGEDVAEEIISAIAEAKGESEEGEGKDETVDVADAIAQAVEEVNEKRKSRKEDPIADSDTEEIVAAVAEIVEGMEEEGKSRKSTVTRREVKYARAGGPVQRKYSSIYMGGRNMAGKKGRKERPAPVLMARAIKCMDVWAKGDPEKAAYYARKNYGDEDMSREFKALSATVGSEGGYLIPEAYADQIIELLYPKTVIFELGAQKVPLTNGNLNIPKMTAGSRAMWGGEKRKIQSTQPAFGNMRLSAKRLQAIVPQTKELLMSSSYSSDQLFANDLMRRMQLGLDYGALYGRGGEFEPVGVARNKGVEVLDAKKLETELADADGSITADLPVYVRSKAFMKNIDDTAAGWTMNSMLEGVFMNMKTSTGAYIYRDEMVAGKLLGFPYKVCNQIPADKGATELFFGNWADLLVGDQMGLETYTTMDGSWTDEEGREHNAFDENMAATRATMYDDIGVRHEESFLRVENIKVGKLA